jgi:gas vesicle protein
MNPGLIGGIIGSLVGIASGLVGTYFSIRNTNGPRERAFMVWSAVVCWFGVSVFLVVLFLPPQAGARYREVLREEIAQTVNGEAEVSAELRDLWRILSS